MQVGEPSRIVGETSSTPPVVEILPAAMWYDNSQQHFVALLERSPSAVPSLLSELVEYRVLTYNETSSTLDPSFVTRFRLPCVLATEEYCVGTTTVLCRRIPLLSKLSLDKELLAIQFSPTLIRIIPLEDSNNSHDNSTKHWTVDLTQGGEPQAALSHMMPTSASRYKVHDPLGKIRETRILPGGIIWSDHGGKSQDLIVVTTGAVLCYKVSMIRKQMAFSHTYHHPHASAMWYEPISRTIVISSMERGVDKLAKDETEGVMLNLRTVMLRFPKPGKAKRLPRLELPPPHRLDPFTVGGRILPLHSDGNDSNRRSFNLSCKVALVNLYRSPHIVEIGLQGDRLRVKFYQLDRTHGVKVVKDVVVQGFKPILEELESMIIGVLDNVLCVCLRDSRKNVYVDVDETTEYCFVEDWVDDESCLENPNLCFILPSQLLDPAGRGMLYPVDLDITMLSEMMQESYCPLPFILRRSLPEAHKLALDKSASILAMSSRSQRRQWVNAVADVYAKRHNSLRRDWISCIPLIYNCALLPPGSEFRHHSIDTDYAFCPKSSQIIQGRSYQTLHQREILECVLLPEAKAAVASSKPSRLQLVLDIALTILGALDARDCPPCPALECLIVSILWQLGCYQEIETLLASRSRHFTNANLNPVDEFFRQNQRVVSISTNIFISTLLALSKEVRFGQYRYQDSSHVAQAFHYSSMFRACILSQSTMLFSSRFAKPRVLLDNLMGQGRVLDAMSICSRLGPTVVPDCTASMDCLPVYETRKVEDSPFFHASILKARQLDPEKACHIFNTLQAFISLRDNGDIQAVGNHRCHRRCRSFESLVDTCSMQIACRRSSLGDITEKTMNDRFDSKISGRKLEFVRPRFSSNKFEFLLQSVAPKGIREGVCKVYGLEY